MSYPGPKMSSFMKQLSVRCRSSCVTSRWRPPRGDPMSFQGPVGLETLPPCSLAHSPGSGFDANHYCFLFDAGCILLRGVFLNVTELVKGRHVPVGPLSGTSRLSALILALFLVNMPHDKQFVTSRE